MNMNMNGYMNTDMDLDTDIVHVVYISKDNF
jgi:hypothetical protein